MKDSFSLNTLHRRKYMLYFVSLVFISGGLSSVIPTSEIIKIIIVLFAIPLVLYISVRLSQNTSTWQIDNESISIHFTNKSFYYPISDIDHIRTLTRSGGTLYIIYFKQKSPARYWCNKLFQPEDNNKLLQNRLSNSNITYYKF